MLLRRVRAEAALLLLLFAIVATTSFLFAAAPRVLNRVADDALRFSLGNSSPVERDVRMNSTGTIEPGTGGGVSAVRAYGELRQPELPASVVDLVSNQYLGITSVRFAVEDSIVAVYFRYQDGMSDATRLVSGRWPVDRGMPLELNEPGQSPGPIVSPQRVRFLAGPTDPPAVFEGALSSAAAETIGAQIGDRLPLALDITDSLVPRQLYGIAPAEMELVGIFEPIDPDADVWAGNSLLQPALQLGPGGVEGVHVTAFMAAETYPNLHTELLPFRYDWHYQVDPARVDADRVETLRADLRRLDLVASSEDDRVLTELSSTVELRDVAFGSGLLTLVEGFAAQRARSESVLSIAALGPLCLAAAAFGMLAVLLIRRRGGSLLLARGRGASTGLLLGAQLLEAVLIAGSASLVGLIVALNLVPARESAMSSTLALGVAAGATLLLLAATWPIARRPLLQSERDDPPVLRVAPRRLVIEATIVGIAVLAVVLLRQRGLTLGPTPGAGPSDPLLAAVPLLSGLAAGIILMRLYPLPVRGLGWLAARRRDFVPVAGLRTVARHPAIANLPLLVLMLTAAFGAFSSVVKSSIDRGQVTASYLQVGADYRLEDIGIGGLPAALDPTVVPGVEAVASGLVYPRAVFIDAANQRATMDVYAIEPDAYAAVTAGTEADPRWPRAFLGQPTGADIGTDANPIPALASPGFPRGRGDIRTGDRFTVEVAGRPLMFQLVERRAGIPGLGHAADFTIVPLDWITAALPDASLAPTVMWLRAPADAAAPLATTVEAASREIRIISRQDAYAFVHDAPLGSAVADGFGVALGVAVLYLAITLIGAVLMSAAARSRDLAYLRTLGVSSRQALGLTVIEHLPPVLLALIPGVLLGVAVANVVEPGLGLINFTGGQAVALSVDWLTLGAVIGALSAVVLVAIGVGSWLATRERVASALRIEDS